MAAGVDATGAVGPRRSLAGLAGPGVLIGEPDERLVALAIDGDERAFAAIVTRYRAPLLRYCQRILAPANAEDALQQTFINAHAALSRTGAGTRIALRPWLYRVAHNAALNIARDPQLGLAPVPESLDGPAPPDGVVEQRDDLERVVGAMKALPERQREVIVRHELGGDSHERIAADLGMSAGAVRQLAYRARAAIRSAAAALLPEPVLRLLPWLGPGPVEGAATGAGAAAAAAAALLVAGAGGGAIHAVTAHDGDRPARSEPATRPAEPRRAPTRLEITGRATAPAVTGGVRDRTGRSDDSSGPGSGGDDRVGDSSGPGSGASDSSGPGDGTSGTSDSSGPGSGTSTTSGSSGSGSGTIDSSGSGSGTIGSSGPGSGTTATSDSSGSGSGTSGTSGTSGSGSGSEIDDQSSSGSG